jgi:hypothetical protein
MFKFMSDHYSLQSAFHFTQEDLHYNRLLRPSPGQLKLFTHQEDANIFTLLNYLLLFSGAVLVAMLIADAIFYGVILNLRDMLATAMMLSAVGLFVYVAARNWEPRLMIYRRHITLRIEPFKGSLKLKHGALHRYIAQIKDKEFYLTHEQYEALKAGLSYCFYYAPGLNRVLSVEEAVPEKTLMTQ